MKNLMPLMLREWLQHRFAWTLMVLVPLALAAVGLSFGSIQLDEETLNQPVDQVALMVGTISMAISTMVLCMMLSVTSLFIALGSPRRDDGDRSTEFWLSMPSGHAESLLAPMLVHLLLVPIAALAVGLVVSLPISLIVVGRTAGFTAWLGLPWFEVLVAMGALALRVAAGVPLAVLWLLPLLLAAMLANAVARRWGLPLLAVALGMTAWLLERVFGQPLLWDTLGRMGLMAARSLGGAGGSEVDVGSGTPPQAVMRMLPPLLASDFGDALGLLMQPLFFGTLLASGLLFTLLVLWRQRGASAA